jgi:glycosyltransferase involved in cell wall biosynthesis
MTLTVIILTKNEELHIERAMASVAGIADRCLVVDSGSTDATLRLAKSAGAEILSNPWTNHATQFNWALDQLGPETQWVLRLDADEIVTAALAAEIKSMLPTLGPDIAGVYVSRRMAFLGRRIKWGGLFPLRVMRLFRHGQGQCENRWMDEHIIASGPAVDFVGEIIDDNRNSLGWWTEKHNAYASREVVDLLSLEYGFAKTDPLANVGQRSQASVKRWIKENVYARLPAGLRAFAYFFYRYILRLGFLDGKEGAAFHVLQGLWYRYLVDMKLHEVKNFMNKTGVEPKEAIRSVLGIDLT